MSRKTAFGALIVVAMLAVIAAALPASAAVSSGAATGGTIRIWTDKDRRADIDRIAKAWGARRGVTVEVVEKGFGDIRDQLKTVQPATAPDVIIGAHDWTGQLAADGLVLPLSPSAATRKQFPKYALDAFSYGSAVKRLYGAPVALENVGLVVNTRLAGVPKTWAQLERAALRFKNRSPDNLAIAVPQAPAGDAYHMYPFFSGLGGFVFGKNKAGNLNPRRIGVANPTFLRNAPMIDRWDRLGLINSKVNYDTAKNAFLKGQAAFWITGPWEADTLKQSGLRFRIVQLPKIKFRSVPFLGVQGFMVTRYSNTHGVGSLAKDLVASYIMRAASQRALAAANGRFPANTVAGKQVRDSVLAQFGRAGQGGVPMPNIPQMSSVWEELGGAWLKSTNGTATNARPTFSTAARNIRTKIG
jgi:arabinogalactan oligomer/maltooligosaccharide transport system substrate-binding protein